MSLIIEALKRARDDAVRRQAASRGLPLAPIPRIQGRSRWLAFALIPLVAALVVCILLLIDLNSKVPETAKAQATSPTPAEAAPTSPPQDAEPLLPANQPPPQDQSAAPETDRPASPPPKAEAVASSPAVDPGTTPVAGTVAIEEPSPAPPESHRRPSATGPASREFVGQAQLEDGQLVDLDGIAWSESEPFALLNGQVVGVGEWVRSYRVVEIAPDQVTLEKDQDRIVLRLK